MTGKSALARWQTRIALIAACVICGAAGIASAPTVLRAGVAFAATPAASPVAATAAGTIEISGLVTNPGPVSVSELQTLPNETVDVTYESGGGSENHAFTGVRLYDALEQVGLAIDPEARNPLLRMYVVITANDGYQVVLSGGELDPNFGNAPMLLAWEQDGAPLSAEDGPLRLVVPGDLRGGRYIYGIVSVEVRMVEETPS